MGHHRWGTFLESLIPMMIALEERLRGISDLDGRVHRAKFFADDLKALLKDPSEVDILYSTVCDLKVFQVSGCTGTQQEGNVRLYPLALTESFKTGQSGLLLKAL